MKKYCVIAPTVNMVVPRNWKDTKEEAVEHAAKIMRNMDTSRRHNTKLIVVEAIEVVEVAYPPVMTREVNESDLD